jgi:threonine dehydrogenase-like Zn-dependent dehydrogenase
MAVNAASNAAQKAMGDEPTATTTKHTDQSRSEALDSGETMLALTWQGKGKVQVKEMPKPKIMDENDALIKVTGSTVCGSDLHLYNGDILQLKADDILGHEGMGVVEAVGSNVKKIKVGDRVVASFSIACGTCKFCKEGLGSMCEKTNSSSVMKKLYGQNFSGLLGYGHFTGGYSGCQAEYFRSPFADNNLLKITGDIADEKVMFLSDIVCTSYHSVVDVDFKEGQTAAIWGAGPVGLNIAQWVKKVRPSPSPWSLVS